MRGEGGPGPWLLLELSWEEKRIGEEGKGSTRIVQVANWSQVKLVVCLLTLLVYPEKVPLTWRGGCGLACCDHCPFGEGCV